VLPELITELDWWESHNLPNTGLSVTAAPSQHFSGRSFKARNTTLWSSLVLRSDHHTVFFSGDTGLTTEYQAIRARLGPFDLADASTWRAGRAKPCAKSEPVVARR
jgi:L-ascorbate metabolism protein UlaG (beta-lactamase superfamily)